MVICLSVYQSLSPISFTFRPAPVSFTFTFIPPNTSDHLWQLKTSTQPWLCSIEDQISVQVSAKKGPKLGLSFWNWDRSLMTVYMYTERVDLDSDYFEV